jgi:hypothetical protein
MQIYIDFNSLPTGVYSIQLNNVFIYSMSMFSPPFFSLYKFSLFTDDQYKQILKNMGNGLSLVAVQNINSMEDQTEKPNTCTDLVRKEDIIREKPSIQQIEEIKPSSNGSSTSFYEPSEQDKILFEKVWENRMRIEMQHQQLMSKAAKLLCYSTMHNDSFISKNTQIIN